MLFEPFNQTIDIIMNLIPVPESVWCHRQIFNSRFGSRLIPETKLSRKLLGCTEEIWYTFRVF